MTTKKPSEKKKPTPETGKKLEEDLQKISQELKEKNDKLLRSYADFQNYQKRMEKEILSKEEDIKKQYLSELLDLFELLTKVKDDNNPKEGIEAIRKHLQSLFDREQITPIESIGKPFDHNIHHAVSTIEKNDSPEDLIIEEIKKGYMLKGKIMRPSQVIVAKKKTTNEVKEV
jgi:molecular chaperone GrpE